MRLSWFPVLFLVEVGTGYGISVPSTVMDAGLGMISFSHLEV